MKDIISRKRNLKEKKKEKRKGKCVLVAKLLYKSKCPSVRMSTTFRGKRDFLGLLFRCRSNFVL